MRQFTDEKIRVTIEKIKSLSVKTVYTIPEWKYIKCDYKVGNQAPQVDDSWGTFEREQRVGGSDDHYWFYTEFKTPDISENEEIYFELTTGQEGRPNARFAQTIAYLNGEAIQGLDTNHTKVYLEPNKEYVVEGIKFKTIPAYNTNKTFHPKGNDWVGYIITINNIRYYIAGDTDITEENKKVKCDVAFVPVGGTYTMDFKEAAQLINEIQPKIAIPIHYGSVVGTNQDATDFVKLLNPSIKGIILMKQ